MRANSQNQLRFDFNSNPAAVPLHPVAHQRAIFNDDEILSRAAAILEERAARYSTDFISSPAKAAEMAKYRMGVLEHEEFAVFWLDAQNRLIEFETLFRGTLTQASVYPREVVKSALAKNACACILSHNHPSGNAEPSRADENLTRVLKDALALVDVRVFDHLIVACNQTTSFAERGIL